MSQAAPATPDTVENIVARLPKFFTVSIIARRGSGKSVLVQELIDIVLKKKIVDIVLVMSDSAGLNHDYEDLIPKKLIQPFSDAVLEKIWNLQASTKIEERKHILIVLDDCLANPEAVKSKWIDKYFSVSRHLNISMCVLSQHTSILLTPLRRGNSDLIIWAKLSHHALDALSKNVSNLTTKQFIQISEKFSAHNYQFMVFDQYISSPNPAEFLTFVKASPPKKKKKKKIEDSDGQEYPQPQKPKLPLYDFSD